MNIKQQKFHKFSYQLTTTYVSIHQNWIKIVEAEPLNVVLSAIFISKITANWCLEKVYRNLWLDSSKPSSIGSGLQGLHWKTFWIIWNFRFSSVRSNCCRLKVKETCEPKLGSRLSFLIGSHVNQLPYFFKVLLVQNHHFFHNMNGIQTSCILV